MINFNWYSFNLLVFIWFLLPFTLSNRSWPNLSYKFTPPQINSAALVHIAIISISRRSVNLFPCSLSCTFNLATITGLNSLLWSGIHLCNFITRTLQQFSNLNKYVHVLGWWSVWWGGWDGSMLLHIFIYEFMTHISLRLNGRQRPAILHLCPSAMKYDGICRATLHEEKCRHMHYEIRKTSKELTI